MNYEVLGAYRGKEVHMISKKEFFMALDEMDRQTSNHMWMILDDNRLIYGGKVIGQINKARNSVQDVPASDYRIVYGNYIRNYVEPKQEVAIEKEAEPKAQTLTERITVEKLFKQGEEMLKKISHEAEDKYLDSGNEGAEKLAAFFEAGRVLANKYKMKRSAV